jgi:hypothetical protein
MGKLSDWAKLALEVTRAFHPNATTIQSHREVAEIRGEMRAGEIGEKEGQRGHRDRGGEAGQTETRTIISNGPSPRMKELRAELDQAEKDLEHREKKSVHDTLKGMANEKRRSEEIQRSAKPAVDNSPRKPVSDSRPPEREGSTPHGPVPQESAGRSVEPARSGGREAGSDGRLRLERAREQAAPAQGASNEAQTAVSANQQPGSDGRPRIDQAPDPAKAAEAGNSAQNATSADQQRGSDGKLRLGQETSSSASAQQESSSQQETSSTSSESQEKSTSHERSR